MVFSLSARKRVSLTVDGSGPPFSQTGTSMKSRAMRPPNHKAHQTRHSNTTVRELDESKFEVVAGARRLRAAKLADLEKLPVRVVKLTDAEAIEAQCVELFVVRKSFLC